MRRIWILSFLLILLLRGHAAFGWSFGVCGDSRDDIHGVFPRILATVEKSDMEFLLHLGDIEPSGGAASWQTFRERTKGFPKPLFLVFGNHELYGSTAEEFARFFGLPGTSYSFTHKDAHFTIVDNASGSLPDTLLSWLEQDLARHPRTADGIRYLVMAMHIPPRTDDILPHGTEKDYGTQSERLRTILKRYKVDLLLAGHMHMHLVKDWEGIKVIVSGGGGAPLLPFQQFGFYRIDLTKGQVREKFLPIEPERIPVP